MWEPDDQNTKMIVRSRGMVHEASGTRILSGTELEHICVILMQRLWSYSAYASRSSMRLSSNVNGLISLVQEISRQCRIQTMAWLLLIALIQVWDVRRKIITLCS